jgi:hypothetical protein
VLATAAPVLSELGAKVVSVAFTLYPYPPDHQGLVDVTFDEAPAPQKSAQPHYISPWQMHVPLIPLTKLSPELLLGVTASILDRFSYWDVDDFVNWLGNELSGTPSGREPLDGTRPEDIR